MFDLPNLMKPEPEPDKATLNRHYKAIFPQYDWKSHQDYLNLAKEACWWYDDLTTGKSKRWLSMLGQSGTGKTEWSKRLKAKLKADGKIVQMWNWSDVCNNYLAKGDFAILEHLKQLPILIIDEIGQRDWKTGTESLSNLLDSRLKKWTICISNFSQGEIASRMDVRIASRMARNASRIAFMSESCPDYHNKLKRA